jgi:hypothetical protein
MHVTAITSPVEKYSVRLAHWSVVIDFQSGIKKPPGIKLLSVASITIYQTNSKIVFNRMIDAPFVTDHVHHVSQAQQLYVLAVLAAHLSVQPEYNSIHTFIYVVYSTSYK